jgi:hypothetical protein
MVRFVSAIIVAAVLIVPQAEVFAQVSTGQARVLRAIPHIAKVFAPIYGVKWEEFAQSLAGICAVESTCSPTYPHFAGGAYSQYQGLYQMNKGEVAKAEANLQAMMPQIQQLAQSGQIPADTYKFFQEAVQAGQGLDIGARRFHPEYGVILGAAKHIQIHKQLADQYPGQPIRQAAGHMTAQFSGITEGKIKARAFNAPISSAEAWALAVNKAGGGQTVAGAIDSAGASWGKKMGDMMNKMAQVTNNMTLAPTGIEAFTAPPDRYAGAGLYSGIGYSPTSELLESGALRFTDPMVQQNFPSASQGASAVSPVQSSSTAQPSPTSATSAVMPYASTLVMQSTRARAGETISVAWSSVGMKDASCALGVKGGQPFVSGKNEGSQQFQMPASALSGSSLELELNCTSVAGGIVVKGAAIAIE